MSKGRAIQINDKGIRPMVDPPCSIHVPKESLEQLQLELAKHVICRPENLDPALPAWVERKEELKRGIALHQAALPPKVVIVQAPPPPPSKPEPKPEAKEPPMPRPRISPEEKHAKKLEYQRRHREKVKAAAGHVSKKPRKVRTPVERVEETLEPVHMGRQVDEINPVSAKVVHVDQDDSTTVREALASIQAAALQIMSEAVFMSLEDRAALLEPAANADAVVHMLASYLATGRIEVAA